MPMRANAHLHRKQTARALWLNAAGAAALTLAAGLAATSANAQDAAAAPAAAAADGTVATVVVTGSRIVRSGFTTPTPVTGFSQTEIQSKAIGTVTSLVTEIPQLAPTTVPVGSTNPGSAFLNLRGVGAQRTLLLVDGRRFAQTSPTGGTDVNVLPSSLIKSIDVVTGGASAAYGSDAVAGVVEVTLDNRFVGLKGNIQAGETPHGDSRELVGSIGYGTAFANDRGHVVVAVDAYYNGGILQENRDWGRQAWGTVANPGYPNNGVARQLITPGVRLSGMTNGGVITSAGPLANIQFGAGGQPLPFNKGAYAGTTFMVGGDGADLSQQAAAAAKNQRTVGFTHLSYDITPQVTGWADALVANQASRYYVIPSYNSGDIVITQQNAYLPASILATMKANSLSSFNMGRTNLELGWNKALGLNTTQRYGAGLDGRFGDTWKWSAFLQYSTNRQYAADGNDLNLGNWKNAIDSVISPTTGQPVCRSTLTNPSNGCVPVNLFGPGAVSSAAVQYATGTQWWNETQTQSIAAANLSGEPFSLWAGPVSIATGVEARYETTGGDSDPISKQFGWRLVNAQPLNGHVSVEEAYLETVVPLLNNAPWVKTLEFNGAVRETHYSFSGWADTWKAGLNYSPTDEIRFRMTASRDLRAPNINELYTSRTQNIQPINDPILNQTNQTLVLTGGNSKLQPEIGNTLTGGVIFQPKWAAGLSVSLDYYHLTLDQAITTLAAQTLVDDCYIKHQTSLCAGITRNANNVISQVFAQQFNAQKTITDGFDIEAAYRFPLDAVFHDAPGQLRLRGIATYVPHLITIVNGVSTNTAGQPTAGGLPHWQGNVSATYDVDKFTFVTEVRYVDGGLFNATYKQGVDINNNHLPSATYVALTGQYQLNKNLQLYARVANLFDVNPPIVPLAVQAPHAANSPFFDVVGRDISIGLRFRY
jgi:outer membrane receptor protein involved in Fe transport